MAVLEAGVIKVSILPYKIIGINILEAFTIRYTNKIPSAALSALNQNLSRKALCKTIVIENVVMFMALFRISKEFTSAIAGILYFYNSSYIN